MDLPQLLYDAGTWLAQPLLRGKLRLRGRAEPGYLEAVGERFGDYTGAPARPQGAVPLVWIHAVSLGETRTTALLLQALRAQWPDMRLVLTHGTATGRAAGRALLRPGDVQVWQPWDTRGATRAFVRHWRPDVGLLMETEVWPNLVRACHAGDVPLLLLNARLSDKSLHGAQRSGADLLRAAYRSLTAVYAQTDADASRLRELGAPVRDVLGNLKYDVVPDADQIARGGTWRVAAGDRPVVLLASSREGEESQFLECVRDWSDARRQRAPDAPLPQWMIVPRHPQRFDAVAEMVRASGLTVSRRGDWSGEPLPADVWLGDSLGEMASYYALASVAILGGSFEPLGGQNLIEAAACGCPVVMGPHVFNFQQPAEQAVRFGAAVAVSDMEVAVQAACRVAYNRVRQAQMVQDSRAFAAAYRGVAVRTAEAVRGVLEEARGQR